MRRLLVTGFGPFPSMPRNPSAAAARAVAGSPRWRLRGVAARPVILTTAYAALPRELDPALSERPDAVLMIGVAGRSKRVRVEWRATGRRSMLFPDVAGERAETPTASGRRTIRKSPLPPDKMLRVLRRHHLPSRLSRDAGRYLCNAAYYRALGTGLPVLFIHIPRTPDPDRPRRTSGPRQTARWPERLAVALAEIAMEMLREGRRGTR
ncbi:peptidase C15 [Enterovirga aerilata]|uniref:Pyroglutamyl-peptidase I n=1 Tax=Enterovirga aerilata TaxID=2730920 RepID=A0A849IEM7_9HYPH|nr:peptidase C15 [Enterovirga sp. DB1703]NNM74899.1 peptidase C15 [Enterovirga sp. DB1703]